MDAICIAPDEIEEGDLAAYVDGAAGEAVARHVRRCPACTDQARDLARLSASLAAGLYRHSCPPPDQLLALLHRELQGGEKLVVSQHLRRCHHCAREMASLAREEKAGLVERIRAVVQVEVTPVTALAQPASVRGGSACGAAPLVYRAGETEVIVSQQPSRAQPERWDVSGLIHVGGQVPGDAGSVRAELYRDKGLIDVTTVNPRGYLVFREVEAAVYDLGLTWEERQLLLRGVRVE